MPRQPGLAPLVLREINRDVYYGAVELVDLLYTEYTNALQQALDRGEYPHPASESIRRFIGDRGMDRPRVTIVTPDTVESIAAEYDSVEEVLPAAKDSLVVRFCLPKPLEAFWHKNGADGFYYLFEIFTSPYPYTEHTD